MKIITTIITAALIMGAYADNASIAGAFAQNASSERDPSNDPVVNDEAPAQDIKAGKAKPYLERRRIVTDLNGDGIDDLILSDPVDSYGRTPGAMIYICTDSKWTYVGDITFNHDSFAIEKTHNGVDLWSYSNAGGRQGTIICTKFADGKALPDISKISVNFGDGQNSVASRLYSALFDCPGVHPFRMEESETSKDGMVTWKFLKDHRRADKKNEQNDVNERLLQAQKRIAELEEKLAAMSAELEMFKRGTMEICSVKLGEKWKGGKLCYPCEEIFSGFTNMVIKLDENGYVKGIRLIRKESSQTLKALNTARNSVTIPEEQKTINEIENRFNVRLMQGLSAYSNGSRRVYAWGNPILGNWIEVSFAGEENNESRIDLVYSRDYLRRPCNDF